MMTRNLMRNPKTKLLDKRLIFVLIGLVLCMFILLFILRKWINVNDERLPIDIHFKNELITNETIRFRLNDSLYSFKLDRNEKRKMKLLYRNGINKIYINLSDSTPIIDDTLSIKTRDPGGMIVVIDRPTDELGFQWEVDSTNIKKYCFYNSLIKEQKEKRVKIAVMKGMIE